MRSEIARWGDSLAVRLPRRIAEQARLAEGMPVDLAVEDDQVVMRPGTGRPHYALDALLDRITPENLPDETFDDRPRGREPL